MIKVTPEFRANTRSFRAGLVVLTWIGLMLALTFKAQTGMPFAPTTKVQAYFDNVHSLKANDLVREDSRRIGRVSDISYKNGRALVTMVLDGKVDVYQNASAEVWDLSALATKFVELDRGSSTAGALDDTPIPADRTEDSADLYQVLDILDAPTRKAATGSLRELGSGLGGHGRDLDDFLKDGPADFRDIGAISGAASSSQADLPGLLQTADRLTTRFRGRQQQLADLVHQTGRTMDAVGVDGGAPLRKTVHELPTALAHTDTAMSKLHGPLADTAAAMTSLAPGARALGAATPNLRAFLRDAVPVARKVPGVAHQAKPVVEDLTDVMTDARPFAPRLRDALADLLPPLAALAPYTTDLEQLFLRGRSFVSQGPNPGTRYARLGVTPGINTITGGLVPSGTNLPQNNYPAPGRAQYDRASGIVPPGLP